MNVEQASQSVPRFKYFAFISYSRKDSKAAAWLQKRLEWFRFPVKLVRDDRRPPDPRYVRPIYRDKTNLEVTNDHYWKNIRQALEESRYLIVLSSPDSAKSEPVELEVAHFLATHGNDSSLIAPVILSGNITSSGDDASLCPSLGTLGDTITTRNLPTMVPDTATAEQDAWEQGFVSLVSYLLQLERRTLGDHIQRETKRQARVLRRWLVAVGMLTVIAGVSAWLAFNAKREAEKANAVIVEKNEINLKNLHEASMADYAVAVQRIEKENKWHEGVAHLARSLKWQPDNPLAAARLYSTLSLYAAEKQSWPRSVLRHEGNVTNAQFSRDGTRMVTASDDKTARVWDTASGQAIGEPLEHSENVNSAQFSRDGTRIVTASDDFTAQVWDAATGKALGEPLRHEGFVNSARFSPDGTRILTASDDKTARVWDAATGKALGEPLRHKGDLIFAQFSPDGTRIVIAGDDKTARVWDAATGQALGEPLRHEHDLIFAQFSPDGTRIVTASNDKTARVGDAATGKAIGKPLRHESSVNSAQFSPDGTRVVTVSDDKTARVWSVATGNAIGEPLSHESNVNSAQFSPDGTRILTASGDKTARVWDAATGKAIGEPLRHKDDLTFAQFSPDGTRIVTASNDKTARVWDAATGQAIGEPLSHESNVNSAQFSPDGTRILTASDDKTARVWDAATSQAIGEPLRHEDEVKIAEFSLDGRRIVTVSADKTARVWDAATSQAIGEPLRHEGYVFSAQFSPGSTRIVTGGDDMTARLWDAPVLPRPSVSVPEWMLQRARCIAGLDFDADGQMRTVPVDQRITPLVEPPPGNDSWARLARWLAQPAQERTLTPDSRFTCRQIAERERNSGTKEGIDSSIRYDPTVPLAHVLLAEALLHKDTEKEAEERDPSVPQRSAFLRDYGLKHLPEDAALWSRASQSLLNQHQGAVALDAARKAVALNASLTAAHRALARALSASGKQTEAVTAWDKVMGGKDATFVDFGEAGELAALQNLGDKTQAIFREAEQRFPSIPRILLNKAKAMLLLHTPDQALAAIQAYEPKFAAYYGNGSKPPKDARVMLAVSHWLTGGKDAAVADYQRLIGQVSGYVNVDAVTKSDWPDAIKQPLLEVLAETLNRHPELTLKPEKDQPK